MITPSTFKVRFTEFDSIDDSLIQLLLDEAYLLIRENNYLDTMVLYWVAHTLTIQQNQVNGDSDSKSAIASKSVGNVSVSYANPTIENPDIAYFMSTSYGQQYLKYKRIITIGNVSLV